MKDKQRAKRKAKRKQEKLKEAHASIEAFKQDIAAQGIKLRPGTKDIDIYKAQERVEKAMFKESIGMSIISMAYVLHEKYEWGNQKLWDLIPYIARIVTAVGNGDRSIDQLTEEFYCETHVDFGEIINDRFDAIKEERGIVLAGDEALCELVAGMLYRIKYLAILALYIMYYYFGWKQRKLVNLVTAMGDVIADVLLSKPQDARNRFEFTQLNVYINKLEKSCKLSFDKFGTASNLKGMVNKNDV